MTMVAETVFGVAACGWMVMSGRAPIGACNAAGLIGAMREVLSEALTAVLALLLAARGPGPPLPPRPGGGTPRAGDEPP